MAGRTGLHVGWSNSLGWYEGFCLLISVNPEGVITGFGFAPASTKDQPLAETFFALRSEANPRLGSVGSAALGPYVADKGFARVKRIIEDGSEATGRASSVRLNATDARGDGPSGLGVGRRPSARS
jgi:hypothetical protein